MVVNSAAIKAVPKPSRTPRKSAWVIEHDFTSLGIRTPNTAPKGKTNQLETRTEYAAKAVVSRIRLVKDVSGE